uniref:Protein ACCUMULATION AND REPLICATION OF CHLOROPLASTS 3 n=1 Tax=Rhizophora mucronata TaxID=61149 RepID=A0A2P2P0I4_RHIMU
MLGKNMMDQLLLFLRVPPAVPLLAKRLQSISGMAVSQFPLSSNWKTRRSFFLGRAKLKYGIITGVGVGGVGGGGRRCKCTSKSKIKSDCCEELESESESGSKWKSEFEYVEVIGIGSRKDAVLDFCLDSDFLSSSSLRFWSINSKDSQNVQLQERFPGKVLNPGNVEASQLLETCLKAIILVCTSLLCNSHTEAVIGLEMIVLVFNLEYYTFKTH